jgi:6-phosphogluconate dehydrogenase
MVRRILKDHDVVAFDINPESVAKAAELGAEPAASLKNLASKLRPPRVVWVMVPAGKPVDLVIDGLELHLEEGDILIDGGNSHYRDSTQRAERLLEEGILYLDVGTSGGLEGAEKGASLTIGGSEGAYEQVIPLLETIARGGGYLHCGLSGVGHYVKMVHNGIEYAMLQALGEGFEMLESGPYELDLEAVARVWNTGTVIRSWMLELVGRAFGADPRLDALTGEIGGGETGRWMVEAAMEQGVPTPAIALSLMMRYRSRQEDTFAGKVVAAIRREFGGHPVKAAE